MQARYINPFLNATINLFRMTFAVDAKPGEPYLLENLLKHRWEISGVMAMHGSAIGVVAIRLTNTVSNKLLERSGLTYADEDERSALVKEMVGEMVNIIAGNASTTLEQYEIDISVPFVVQGAHHVVTWPQRSPIISIPFSTPYGPFEVNVSMIEPVRTSRRYASQSGEKAN